MPEPIKIIVEAQTAEAAEALRKFLADTGTGLGEVEKKAHAATSALGSNRMAIMELGHSARAMADGLAAGMSPVRLLMMEAPRMAQSIGEASAEMRAKLMSFLPALGAVGVAVAAGVGLWKGLGAEWERAVARNNQLTESFKQQADAIKVVNAAAKGGALDEGTRTRLLGELGLPMNQGKFSLSLQSSAMPPTQNMQADRHGIGGDISMSAIGLPDREAVARVNEELAKMGILLKTINPSTREISYAVNPEIAELAELTSMREKYEAQMELDFDKQRARAERQHAEDLRNLNVQIATAEQFRTQLENKLQSEKDPNARSAMETVMGKFDPQKLNDDRAVLEEQYQAKLNDITARETEKRERTQEEAEHKFNEWHAKELEQNKQEAERQDKNLADGIEALREQTKDKSIRLYAEEYSARMALANQQLAQCVIDEDQYTDKITQAAKLRAQGEKEYNAELQRTADLKRSVERGQLEAEMEQIKGNPFLTDQQKTAGSVGPIRGLMANNATAIGSLSQVANGSPDEAARLEAQGKITELMKQQVQLQQQLDAAAGQNSFAYQFLQVLTKLQSEGGTIQEQVAGIFGNTMQSGINGTSKAITGLIEGTTTWKKALMEITQSTLGQLIQGFVHMGVQWVAQHVLMAAATRMLGITTQESHAVATTSTVASATTQLAAHAAVAAGGAASAEASIPYVGPVLAVAAMGAMLAEVLGLASGFAAGGYTGDGGMFQPAGVVHRGEFVFNAAAVDRLGVGNLEALHRGDVTGAFSGTAGTGAAAILPPKVVTVFDRQSLQEELKRSDYAHITVQHVMNNKQRIGIRT